MKNKPLITVGIFVGVVAIGILVFIALSGRDSDIISNNPSFPEGTNVDRVIQDEVSNSAPVVGPYTRLSRAPVSGYIPFTREVVDEITGSTTIKTFARFVDTTTGHVHEVDVESSQTPQKITTTTVPKTFESFFLGINNVLLRYIDESDDLISYLASINEEERVLDGTYLPSNIRSVSAEEDGVIALQPTTGGTMGVIYSPEGDVRNSGSFPLRDLDIKWESPTRALVWTRPSNNILSYVWQFNPQTGGTSVLLRNTRGTTAQLSPSGSYLLYTDSSRGRNSLNMRNLDTGNTTRLSFFTFAEKCGWDDNETNLYCAVPNSLPSRNLPDAWYKGEIRFNDVLYRVTSSDSFQAREYIWDPGEYGFLFDINKLEILDNKIFFVDKITGLLGVVDLTQ